MSTTTAGQMLEQKGHEVISVGPDDTVYKAIETLAEHNIGALAVMEGETFLGIMSERDYTRNVILKGRSSSETKVRDIMVTKVFYVTPDQDLNACMAVVTDKHVRHLPVLEDGKLVGMLSIGDLLKDIIDQQRFHIAQLEQFIQS